MERCPTCRARLKKATICPRCQSNLKRVFKINQRSEFLCQQAMIKLKQNEIQLAVWTIKEALLLQRSQLALTAQKFISQHLEQQAVTYLSRGQKMLAIKTLDLTLSLKKTTFALNLYHFIHQQN